MVLGIGKGKKEKEEEEKKKEDQEKEQAPDETEEFNFDDINDVIKFVLTIHDKSLKKFVSSDILMFQPEDKDIEFIREQFKVASQLKIFIPDTTEARKVYNMIIDDIRLIIILKRNREKNFILGALLDKMRKSSSQNVESDSGGLLSPSSSEA